MDNNVNKEYIAYIEPNVVRKVDIFDDDDQTWVTLGEGIREGLTAYWPETEPDAAKIDALCKREAIEEAEKEVAEGAAPIALNAAKKALDEKYYGSI